MATPQTQQQAIWALDTAHTLTEFSARHMMVTTVKGHFQKVAGTITVDESDLANSSVEVVIETASVTTGDERRDGHLRSPDFFNVEQFPLMTFKSTKVESVDSERLRVAGDLTIRDVTRPVVLEAIINGRGKTPYGKEVAGISATTKINRKDFGLTWNVGLETGGVLVGDEVKISIEAELINTAN